MGKEKITPPIRDSSLYRASFNAITLQSARYIESRSINFNYHGKVLGKIRLGLKVTLLLSISL
jgi:hypothetical protein